MNNKKEIIEKLGDALGKAFEEQQKKPFQYVVAYYKTKDDTFLGYHSGTFCTLTSEKLKGKRYNGENPYSQLRIIRTNLDYTLDMTPEKAETTLFGKLNLDVKDKYFKGLEKNDIYIVAEYLEDGIPPQKFEMTVINPEK